MKRHLKELFRDSITYGASSLLSQFISLFLIPFYTRELEPSDYGIFAISSMLLSFLAPIGALGMDGALFRYYSMSESPIEKLRYVSSATALKTIGMFFLLLLLIILFPVINVSFFEKKLTSFQYALILATFIVEGFTLLTIAVMRSERRVLRIARNNIITLLVSVGIALWLVIGEKMKVDGVLLAGLFAAVLKALLYFNESTKLFNFKLVEKSIALKLLSYGIPVIPHKLQGQVISLFTIFIINQKLGIATAGLYAVAQKMSKPLSFVVGMVQQSWTPYKFQMHKTEDNPQEAFKSIISLYWMLLIFLWGALSLIMPYLFRLIADHKYWNAIPYLPFIMFLSISQGFYFTVTTGFELSDKQYKMMKGSFWGMIAMIGTSLLTLNFFAPFSFILCQSLAFFVMAFVLLPEARKEIRIDYPYFPILGFLVFAVLAVYLSQKFDSLWVQFGTLFILLIGFFITSIAILPPKYYYRSKDLIKKKLKLIGM